MYFDPKHRPYLNEAKATTKPLEDYLNALPESDVTRIEAIMYFGRDPKEIHGNDLAGIREHLKEMKTDVHETVHNIVEKYGALPLYFSEALQKAHDEGIDLNLEF